MAFARTQHHPVFAEGDRLLVLIGSDMSDGENRHCNPMILMDSMHFSRQEQGQRQSRPIVNELRRSSSSPITRGSIFRGGLDSSAFPVPNASVTLPGPSASARFAA